MNITIVKNEGKVVLEVEGRLDTSTSPEFEKTVKSCITDATELYLDLKNLEYVSSAGLRIFLMAQKVMMKKGQMVVQNANEIVMEIFEVTGFIDILTIE